MISWKVRCENILYIYMFSFLCSCLFKYARVNSCVNLIRLSSILSRRKYAAIEKTKNKNNTSRKNRGTVDSYICNMRVTLIGIRIYKYRYGIMR